MGSGNKDKATISSTILTKSKFVRTIMEVSQKKGYQYSILQNKRGIQKCCQVFL